jgi:hypothetical protein
VKLIFIIHSQCLYCNHRYCIEMKKKQSYTLLYFCYFIPFADIENWEIMRWKFLFINSSLFSWEILCFFTFFILLFYLKKNKRIGLYSFIICFCFFRRLSHIWCWCWGASIYDLDDFFRRIKITVFCQMLVQFVNFIHLISNRSCKKNIN